MRHLSALLLTAISTLLRDWNLLSTSRSTAAVGRSPPVLLVGSRQNEPS